MEVALMSVATGALKPVLEKLAALLSQKHKRFKEARIEIKFLTDELVAMHNFLLKMSEVEHPGLQDKAWMNEVRELSYDIEDKLDDFMARVGDDRTAKPDGFMEKIRRLLDRTKARLGIAKAIQDLKKQVVEVGMRHARYVTSQSISKESNAMVDRRALAIFEDASKLVGIDGPKDELIQLLAGQEQIKVISIVGLGGLGKTTLANQVYQELLGQFDCHAFFSVSRNPDMMKVLRTILSQVTRKDYANTEARDEQQLITEISSFLLDKRYFVIVDDIWNMEAWDVIQCVFPITNVGSRIITTTRINDVAQSCCSSLGGRIYEIQPLNLMHSRQLFYRRLFNSEEYCPSHLKEVSAQILKKCRGLPLAIIAISGLLCSKESTNEQWDRVKNSFGCALERNSSVEGMIQILSLSYLDLPPHLKTCLLYLSIFPEDQIIKRKGLIRRWISEGFIHKEARYTVHELGDMCFNELINRSLIQPGTRNTYDKVVSCRVHDTILDFIISKSIEENFVTLVGVPNQTIGSQSKPRRLSLQAEEEDSFLLSKNLVLSHVRSLNVFGDAVKIPSLTEFRHLRVLDFGGCRQLENHHLVNIGRLFQLRYLNLRHLGLSELPEEIKNLQCLEMLDLRDTNVRELPATIVNLGRLVLLLVDNCVTFPDGVSKMQALEMLKRVRAFKQSSNFLQELGQLKNLRKIYLDLFDVPVSRATKKECCKKEIAYQSLRNLGTQNLRSVTMWNGGSFLLEPWCPPPLSLKKLMTWRSAVPEVPAWVGSLVNLQKLRLEVENLGPEDLCTLGGLPALLTLDVEETTKTPKEKLSVSGDGFRCLKDFRYNVMLMFTQGSMPKLERIKMYLSVAKTESLAGDIYDFGIENLPCLISVECRVSGNASAEGLEAAKDAIERAAITNPNHPNLLFMNSYLKAKDHVGC